MTKAELSFCKVGNHINEHFPRSQSFRIMAPWKLHMLFSFLKYIFRFKEAVNECTNALEVDAVYAKALIRRAKAYEAMGHYKQALSDIQKANKADSANPDTQVTVARVFSAIILYSFNSVSIYHFEISLASACLISSYNLW